MDFANPIGFYLDDVYISNATATGFPLFDLDRVEVLRGPQGTLWGKNTTGGAIAVISRRPNFDANEGYLKFDVGSFNNRLFEGGANGVVVRDRLAARASFHVETADGRFTNLYDGRSSGEFQDAAVRLQLLGKITSDLTAYGNVHYRKYTTNGTITTVIGSAPDGAYRDGYIPSTNAGDVNTDFPSTTDARQGGANITLNWKLGDYALTSISGFEQYKELSQGDDNTPLNISKSWSDAISQQYSEEVRLASPRADYLNWVLGAFYFHETIRSKAASAKIAGAWGLPSTIPASYAFTKFTHNNDSFAPFASATANISKLFKVSAGLRWTWEHRNLDSNRIGNYGAVVYSDYNEWWNPATITSPLQQTYAVTPSNTWTNFTYDISPTLAITDNVNAYFRFAHGVKSGGYNTSATSASALNVVQPEQLNAYEVGSKSSWFDRRLTANASAFYYDYHDVQINVVGVPVGYSTSVSYLQNASKARIYGAEFELEALPVSFLHFSGNLGLLSAKFTDFQVQNNGGDFSGNTLVRSPKVSTQLIGDVIIPLQGTTRLLVGGDVRYQSKQQYYTTDQGNANLYQLGYTLANAHVTLSAAEEKVNVTLYAANVLDVRYKQHTTPGASGATGNNVMWGAPRTVGLSLSSRWW
jgi:iron complex outermembrane receptor protein